MNSFKNMRKRQNLTLENVAKKVGVSHVAVLKWENGVNAPNAKYLPKLASLFHCSVTDILRLYA